MPYKNDFFIITYFLICTTVFVNIFSIVIIRNANEIVVPINTPITPITLANIRDPPIFKHRLIMAYGLLSNRFMHY